MRQQPPCSTLFPYTTLFRSKEFPLPRVAKTWRLLPYDPEAVQVLASALRLPPAVAQLLWNRGSRDPETRSEEHTSELQSHHDLVCRLLLEKKKIRSTRALRR